MKCHKCTQEIIGRADLHVCTMWPVGTQLGPAITSSKSHKFMKNKYCYLPEEYHDVSCPTCKALNEQREDMEKEIDRKQIAQEEYRKTKFQLLGPVAACQAAELMVDTNATELSLDVKADNIRGKSYKVHVKYEIQSLKEKPLSVDQLDA